MKNFLPKSQTIKNILIVSIFISIVSYTHTNKNTYAQNVSTENEPLQNQTENQTTEKPPENTTDQTASTQDQEGQILGETDTPTENTDTTQPPQEPTTEVQIEQPIETEQVQPQPEIDIPDETNEVEDEFISPVYTPPKNIKVIDISIKDRLITPDPNADHSCKMEFFSVHMSQRDYSEQKILIKSNKNFTKNITISEAPKGFDIKFKRNQNTDITSTVDDFLILSITKRSDAQKGNFNIPIIITENEPRKSIQICQLNLINE